MKIAAITPQITVGAVSKNTDAVIALVGKAAGEAADLAVLPRCALTGDIGGMDKLPPVKAAVKEALDRIAKNTDIPVVTALHDGTAVLISNGAVSILKPDEKISLQGIFLSVAGADALQGVYGDLPSSREFARIIAVPSSYPAFMGGFRRKQLEAAALSAACGGACVAVVSSGTQDSGIGCVKASDKIIAADGRVLAADSDGSEIIYAEYTPKPFSGKFTPLKHPEPTFLPQKGECDEVWGLLARGIVGRLRLTGSKKIILGLSGGLDSSFVLVAAAIAFTRYGLDKKDILAVSMPASASSQRTKNNAALLAGRLGTGFMTIPIDRALKLHLEDMGHTEQDLVYENAQARIRAGLLMDLGNKYGGLVLGTGDLFETALGWSTYGGDQLAHYNPISSLTKSALRFLLRDYIEKSDDKQLKACLSDILDTPVSPELKEGATTEQALGPIELHEFFLLRLLAYGEKGREIVASAVRDMGVCQKDAEKYYSLFISRFFRNQFKAMFGCDGLQLTPWDIAVFNIRFDFDKEIYLLDSNA